uniref:Uncharacterized protein n=1 Tax=Cacopsylla melanoneura TaxID=428564 RepID=A0A8D8LY95_9HEMI
MVAWDVLLLRDTYTNLSFPLVSFTLNEHELMPSHKGSVPSATLAYSWHKGSVSVCPLGHTAVLVWVQRSSTLEGSSSGCSCSAVALAVLGASSEETVAAWRRMKEMARVTAKDVEHRMAMMIWVLKLVGYQMILNRKQFWNNTN